MKFPRLVLRGGPHGSHVTATLDDIQIEKATRVVLDVGVNDVCRAIIYQLVEVDAEVEVLPGDRQKAFKAKVKLFEDSFGEEAVRIRLPKQEVESTADTPWQALYDCGRQLELEAAKTMAVAQGGTIEGPSGRPPGH